MTSYCWLSYVPGWKPGGFLRVFMFLLALSGFYSAEAFESNDSVSVRGDTVVYDYLFVGSKSQNQFTFMGRNFGERVPFTTADIIYYTNFNLWISASAYHFYEKSIPFQTSVTVGYNGNFSKRLDYSVSYGQFLIPASEQISSLQSLGFFQATVGLDWNILYSTLQTQVMTYSTPDVFITSQHSRYFEFSNKLFNRLVVSFQPAFAIAAGTSRFYYSTEEALTGRGGGVTNPRALLGSGNANQNSGNGNGNGNGNAGGNGNGNQGGSNGGSNGGDEDPNDQPIETLDNPGSKINLLNWETELPVTFQWGNFTFEWSTRYSHPLHVAEGDLSRPTFSHSVDLYFNIPVKRKKKIRL
jgi:uncharacterized membrane protein YgcG